MFNKLIKIFKSPESPKVKETAKSKPKSERKKRAPKKEELLSPKDLATKNNEPYVAITKVDIDPENINAGSFELDYNDKFVVNLIKAGYKVKPEDTDTDIVDRWFQTVCRNIALEIYEQQEADPFNRENDLRVVKTRDLGNGRTEVS